MIERAYFAHETLLASYLYLLLEVERVGKQPESWFHCYYHFLKTEKVLLQKGLWEILTICSILCTTKY